MNALMKLNQLKPGLQYKLVSQTGPVHAPIFTMSVEIDGSTFEASGPSKKTAKLHVAVKVRAVYINSCQRALVRRQLDCWLLKVEKGNQIDGDDSRGNNHVWKMS